MPVCNLDCNNTITTLFLYIYWSSCTVFLLAEWLPEGKARDELTKWNDTSFLKNAKHYIKLIYLWKARSVKFVQINKLHKALNDKDDEAARKQNITRKMEQLSYINSRQVNKMHNHNPEIREAVPNVPCLYLVQIKWWNLIEATEIY